MTKPEGRRPEGEVITNAMYPVRGCYQHICAMSGRIKGARPLHMRSSAPRGRKVKKKVNNGRREGECRRLRTAKTEI